ncbi:C40 family peptidase [Pontibacter sp. 172403-2]|uniref:C40 family peptidase n=1 Tax=Pontibacter rufus TaxID=2791028 RepID=UPI0018AF83C8|nr:NlpC/P60 family protein [Pontibacter sp. 172403-2]MBF9254689.1 C40 family peptidase [Pontibacter sp. 172403-2]
MRKPAVLFLSPFLVFIILLSARSHTRKYTSPASETYTMPKSPLRTQSVPAATVQNKADKLVKYALSLQGSPYVYAGIKPSGFDCSGFVTHVFDHFSMDVPHSSALQAEVGKPVQRQQAQPGDLVIFTGTQPSIREPGHVGIVISEPGDTISFVHASSNGGVKVSQVEGSRYNLRFLEVRRIL